MVAPNFYNQADQNIYNKGFSFVPQEMYRGGAFNMPTTPVDNTGGVTTLPTVEVEALIRICQIII